MSTTTQQRGDDHRDLCARRGPCLLLVLCGLPAAGKSSFACAAVASLGDVCTLFPPSESDNAPNQHERRHVHHVCADALYAREVEKRGAEACGASAAANADCSDGGSGGGFDRDAWQQSRNALRDETEALLSRFAPHATSDSSRDACCHHHIIIVDDNMHLRSMVRPYMSLARQYAAGILVAFFDVPVAEAARRNRARAPHCRVPAASFAKLAATMQPPRMPADTPLEYYTRTRTHALADDASAASAASGGADVAPVRRQVDDGDGDDDDTDDQDEPADEASAIASDDRRHRRFRHALRIQLRPKQSDSLAAVSASLDDFSFDHSRVQSAFVDAIPPKAEARDAAEIAKQQELLRQNLVYQADLTLRRLVGRLLSAVSSSAAPAPAANIDSSSHISAPAVPTAALGNGHDFENPRQWQLAVDRLRSLPRAVAATAANASRQRVLAAIRANGMLATNGSDSDPNDGTGSGPGSRGAALPSRLHLCSDAVLEQEFLRALEV